MFWPLTEDAWSLPFPSTLTASCGCLLMDTKAHCLLTTLKWCHNVLTHILAIIAYVLFFPIFSTVLWASLLLVSQIIFITLEKLIIIFKCFQNIFSFDRHLRHSIPVRKHC